MPLNPWILSVQNIIVLNSYLKINKKFDKFNVINVICKLHLEIYNHMYCHTCTWYYNHYCYHTVIAIVNRFSSLIMGSSKVELQWNTNRKLINTQPKKLRTRTILWISPDMMIYDKQQNTISFLRPVYFQNFLNLPVLSSCRRNDVSLGALSITWFFENFFFITLMA